MKISTKRRLLSLLLSLVMVLALAPTALLGENTDQGASGDEKEPGASDPLPPGSITDLKLVCDAWDVGETDYSLTLEPNSSANQGVRIEVSWEPSDATTENLRVVWKSGDEDVAGVTEQENGHVAYIYGKAPGTTKVTVSAGGMEEEILVTVSGIKLLTTEITVLENESAVIGKDEDYELYGRAASAEVIAASVVNDKPNIDVFAQGMSVTIQGRQAGDATVQLEIESAGFTYRAEIHVIVKSNVAVIPWTEGVSPSKPLKFSALEKLIASTCQEEVGEELISIVGLSVSTDQGTIYQGYQSPDDTGAGAGSSITYYVSTAVRGPYIKDLAFVPNPSFTGEKALITFTGNAANNRTFKGRIEVALADAKNEEVTLTTRTDVPLKLKAEDFAKVCQEQTGGSLDYVIFTLPPATQGVLYRDYQNELDYAARVTAAERYNRRALDDITFVPTQGYVGTVTIGYAGYSTTGSKYTGELVIKVTRPLDENIQYQDYGAGEVVFRGSDFDAYSEAMTGNAMRAAGYVSFALPPASQGTLYHRRGSQGTAVTAESQYSLAQLDYIVFVAAEGFDGVVRIPFTGRDRYGAEFSGTAELHIQSYSTTRYGDITYTCQPGQSVKFQLSDFANLCQSATGQRLYYVTFQALPDFTQGSLFYNRTSSGAIGTRVSTAAKYFNSAAPYLSNVSFWASANFRSAEIPFTLAAVTGETFTGLLVINNGEGAGSGRAANVTYTTGAQQPVTFSSSSFDAACRQATNSALQYLRFSLPNSGQGILYYDYAAGVTPTALNASATLYPTGDVTVDKVTFVPASGFSGVSYIPYVATGINGATFQGTVEVTVRAGAPYSSIVHYRTGGAAVRFQGAELTAASSIGQPAAIRFASMPSSSQGRVYYQYVSATQYSTLGNTTVNYSVAGDPSVSSLTFVPRAGYEGVVSLPYTATGYDGTTSEGAIEITVALPETSMYFDDVGACSAQTKAAVDYLSSQGVVNGTAYRKYEPGASILRGDFCLMVSRAFQFSVSGAGQGFADVPAGHYYTQAVQEMYALGIVNGVGGGLFQPEASITRQDAAVMVRRVLDKAGLTLPAGSDEAALVGYRDRDQVDGYAQAALGSLVRAGVFPVSGDQLFPKAAITRADMALLLHRAMTNFS